MTIESFGNSANRSHLEGEEVIGVGEGGRGLVGISVGEENWELMGAHARMDWRRGEGETIWVAREIFMKEGFNSSEGKG